MSNTYKASFAKVTKASKGKAVTFGFKTKSFTSLKDYAEASLCMATVPVKLKSGWRSYDNVTKIYDWLRFDCDKEGEKATICSILNNNGLAYIALPSTNYDKKLKSYKWHISVPTSNTAQDVEQYKKQCKQALATLGIDLHDRRVTEVCVQNMNPYKNGTSVDKGMKFVEVHEGNSFKLQSVDDSIKYTAMNKTIYNGKGSNEIINKKVVSVTDDFELLSPASGIKIGKIGWTTINDLNLEAGGIIGDLSCPGHNIKHENVNVCGYAFATMDEGGDVWLNCTGAECKGRSYKMYQNNFGALTKLTDLYELRRLVSLSAFDYKSSTITYVNSNAILTSFRDKEILNHWYKAIFFKLDVDMNDELQGKIDKLLKEAIKELEEDVATEGSLSELDTKDLLLQTMDSSSLADLYKKYGSYSKVIDVVTAQQVIQFKVDKLKRDHGWKIIEDSIGNPKQYNQFRAKYNTYTDYIDEVVRNVLTHIKTYRQYSEIAYEVKPYQTMTTGDISHGVFKVSFAKVGDSKRSFSELYNAKVGDSKRSFSELYNAKVGDSKRSFSEPYNAILADYKKHNPYLDDIIDMIMAQRFGADKKLSYLWIKASSNWGKSFLFDGVFGSLSYEVSSDEIKKAIKGEPSGLDVNAITKSLCLFVDEFKGAVSELKNISHKIHISPKNRGKFTVPLNMKIFASAEHVKSLMSSTGAMESQFANRFLYIEAKGDLIERDLYKRDMRLYYNTIKLYVNQRINAIEEEYRFYGEADGSKQANDVYSKLIEKYSIKKVSTGLDDELPKLFRDWIEVVRNREVGAFGSVTHTVCLNGMIIFHKDGSKVMLRNVKKILDIFIKEFIADESKAMVSHKLPRNIMNYGNEKSFKLNKKVIKIYPLL